MLTTYTIVQAYPHDTSSFTEGLVYSPVCAGGACTPAFWESSGLYGQSNIHQAQLSNGAVLQSKSLPAQDFAEGITVWGDRVLQLTWQTSKMYSYAQQNLDDVIQRQVRGVCQLKNYLGIEPPSRVSFATLFILCRRH